jgi:hypothetical protein
VNDLNISARHRNSLRVIEIPALLLGMTCLPEHVVPGLHQYRRVERGGQFGCDGDVVVVTVRDDHRNDVSTCDGVDDSIRRVRGVDDYDLIVVADQPHVVVDVPRSATEAEGSRCVTTGRCAGHRS